MDEREVDPKRQESAKFNSSIEPNTNEADSDVRMYADNLGLQRGKDESGVAFRSRVAGELRKRNRIIEAHEVVLGRRWDAPDQKAIKPIVGIAGAIAQELNGKHFSPNDSERQVGDDIAAGVLAITPDTLGNSIRAVFDALGPSAGMDFLEGVRKNQDLKP